MEAPSAESRGKGIEDEPRWLLFTKKKVGEHPLSVSATVWRRVAALDLDATRVAETA